MDKKNNNVSKNRLFVGIVARLFSVLMLSVLCLSLLACGVSFSADKAIAVVVREDFSGTKTAFMEIIGLKGKQDPVGAITQTGTAGVLAEVRANGQAIAYESLGFVDSNVKMLKIDGVEASIANIKNNSYKISRPLSIVYKENTILEGINKHFYEFLFSSDAQSIISENGYVSLYDDAESYVRAGNLSGIINISGSTSLHPLMVELTKRFTAYHSSVTINVSGGGSGTGYGNAENGTSHFGMISEEFVDSKANSCVHAVVAKDGIAVIVNKNNSFENLTISELKNIYDRESTQPYVKWSDIR